MFQPKVACLATVLCAAFSQLVAQGRSAIQFYDSTGGTATGKVGWQGGEGGTFFIDTPNDGIGPGITSDKGNLSVKGTVTAAGFAGDGSSLSNLPTRRIPIDSVTGLSTVIGSHADTNYVKNAASVPHSSLSSSDGSLPDVITVDANGGITMNTNAVVAMNNGLDLKMPTSLGFATYTSLQFTSQSGVSPAADMFAYSYGKHNGNYDHMFFWGYDGATFRNFVAYSFPELIDNSFFPVQAISSTLFAPTLHETHSER